MYPGSGVAELLGVVILLWLGILSYFFWKERKFLEKLFPKKEGEIVDREAVLLLRDKFDSVLASLEQSKRVEEGFRKTLREYSLEGLKHIQKISLIRYNPYEDTGGSVSFSLTLLNGKDTGVILTSLHTRSGTRVYTKEITGGKSELSLSKEEQEGLKKALDL